MGYARILSNSILRIGNKRLYVSQSSNVVNINKYISCYKPFCNHFVFSREYTKIAMFKWKFSIARTQEWKHYWSFGRRTHMGHASEYNDHNSHKKLGGYGEKILKWGLWSDVILTITKAVAGYVSGSTAIIADAAHSTSDIALSGVALWCSKASKAPPNQEHPYGYGKIESIGALGISFLLLMTGGGIAWSAIDALQIFILAISLDQDTTMQARVDTKVHQDTLSYGHNHKHGIVPHKHAFDVEHMEVALLAAILGIAAKESLYQITKAAGEKSGSTMLKANAWHHRVDVVSSIVALVGVGGAMIGMPFLDPIAALIVSGMIIKASLQYGYQSMQELLDKGLPQKSLEPIRKTILQVDGVKGIHQLMGRQMGSIVEVDVHIEVDPSLSLSVVDTIGKTIRQEVQKRNPSISKCFIHIGSCCQSYDVYSNPTNEQSSLSSPCEMDKHSDGHHHEHHQEHHNDGIRVRKDKGMKDLGKIQQKIFNDIQAKFGKVVNVQIVTCQLLQGKVVAEVGISVDPNIWVRDAMQHASEMETYILIQNAKDLAAVNVQLHLSTKLGSS